MPNEIKKFNVAAGGEALPANPWQMPPPQDPVLLLRRYLDFLARKWWIVVVSVACFVLLAAAYVIWWPPSYVSVAHIWISGQTGIKLNEGSTYTEDSLTYAGTQAQLMQSDQIMGRAYQRVTNTLHLAFPLDDHGLPKLPQVKVSQLPKSAVLELTAKGTTPELTMAFLDALMQEYIAYKREMRAASSGDTYTSVSDQIKRQESDLTTAQDKLTTYVRANNVAVLEEQAKAASVYLTQMLAESSDLKVQLQLVDYLMTQDASKFALSTNLLAGASPAGEADNSPSSAGSPSAQLFDAVQQLQKLQILRTRLSQTLRPEHPKMIILNEQIAEGQKLVEFMTRQSRDQLAITAQTIKTKLDGLQTNIKEWEDKVNDTSERLSECERLKENVDRLQQLHDNLLSVLQTVDVSKNMDQDNVNILDHPSSAKSARHSLRVAAFLVCFGVGTGLILVFLLQRLDDHVHSLEEFTEQFDASVVGMVPEIQLSKQPKLIADINGGVPVSTELILADDDHRHAYVESYRNLHSALLYLPGETPRPKVLMVTSAIPQEGKSTVSANLARTMAQAGAKVLLVDADLRRGCLHKLLGLKNEVGLSDLLKQPADLGEYLQFTPNSHLAFISRGSGNGDPGNLFLSAKLDAILLRWRQEFDYVIIDTTPVLAANDAVTLAPKMDGIVVVVRRDYSRIPLVNETLNQLLQRQAKILGVIYNRANASASSYHYYKYAEYAKVTGKA